MPQIARNFPNFWKLQAVENQQKFRRNSLRLFEADPYGCHSQEGTRMGGRRVPGPHHPTIHFPYDNKWLDMDFETKNLGDLFLSFDVNLCFHRIHVVYLS